MFRFKLVGVARNLILSFDPIPTSKRWCEKFSRYQTKKSSIRRFSFPVAWNSFSLNRQRNVNRCSSDGVEWNFFLIWIRLSCCRTSVLKVCLYPCHNEPQVLSTIFGRLNCPGCTNVGLCIDVQRPVSNSTASAVQGLKFYVQGLVQSQKAEMAQKPHLGWLSKCHRVVLRPKLPFCCFPGGLLPVSRQRIYSGGS